MSKGSLVCCVACLMAAPALGQQPAPLPDARVVTTPSGAVYPPFRPDSDDWLAPTPPPGEGLAVEGLGVLARMPDPGPWYATADADFLLRFTQGERAARVAALGGPASLGVGLNTGEDRSGPPLTGGRFAVGVWSADFDPILCPDVRLPCRGVEVSGFFLGERSTTVVGGVAVPGLGASTLAGRAAFEIWGIEANARVNAYQNPPGQWLRADLLAGFRYLALDGDLSAVRQTTFAPDLTNFPAFAPLAGNLISQTASYSVRNRFYGGQVGLGTKLYGIRGVVLGGDFKLALGANHQELNVAGQVLSALPLPAALAGPFPADSGSFSRNKFSYVPQLDLYVAVHVRKNLTARLGYSLLYWSNVARSGDQVELGTGLGNVEIFRDRGLFLHGVDAGLQLSF